jgi:hypothetical protein
MPRVTRQASPTEGHFRPDRNRRKGLHNITPSEDGVKLAAGSGATRNSHRVISPSVPSDRGASLPSVLLYVRLTVSCATTASRLGSGASAVARLKPTSKSSSKAGTTSSPLNTFVRFSRERTSTLLRNGSVAFSNSFTASVLKALALRVDRQTTVLIVGRFAFGYLFAIKRAVEFAVSRRRLPTC